MSYLFVALGGRLGAMLRMFVRQLILFLFGTMSANIIGPFAVVVDLVTFGAKEGSKKALFLMIGILGGFTTVSTFTLEVFSLREAGKIGLAVRYVTLSIVLSVLALCAGTTFVREGDA